MVWRCDEWGTREDIFSVIQSNCRHSMAGEIGYIEFNPSLSIMNEGRAVHIMEDGIIEEWIGAPVVLVKRKDGLLRLCVYFRKLNELMSPDSHPISRVDEMSDQLGGAKYLTMHDLARWYWHVPMNRDVEELTAFITPFMLYQFRVILLGLSGALGSFHWIMDGVVLGMTRFAVAHLDDQVIFSQPWADHAVHAKNVLGRLREAAGLLRQESVRWRYRMVT